MVSRNADSGSRTPPGSESPAVAEAEAIDVAHLSRQTMGDRELEREVLLLFMQQALKFRSQLAKATPEEREILAHGLKGSARGIGAFAIADSAAALEDDPGNRDIVKRLDELIDEAGSFISKIRREV